MSSIVHNKYLFYLCGDRNKASSRVRGYWIAEALSEQGVTCTLEHRQTRKALLWFLIHMPFYHVIFFQKAYSRWHCLLLRFANLLNKKTILDLDDAPSRTNHPVTLQNVAYMMRNVTAVSVGSQALVDYASKFSRNVHLIPSSINLKYYQPKAKQNILNELVFLGWIGNGAHYKRDLIEILVEPLRDLSTRHAIRFKIVGACGEQELYDAFSDIEGLEIDFIDGIEWSAPAAIADALSDFDIGLYPLLPNDFNQYKCGFKALEYMAMGIPVVSSSVAINSEIITHGVDGLLADTKNGWVTALEELIGHADKRMHMGHRGRMKVDEHFNVEKTAALFKSITESNTCSTDDAS